MQFTYAVDGIRSLYKGALSAWQERLPLVRANAAQDPAWKVDLAIALDEIDDAERAMGNTDAACAACGEVLSILARLVEGNPNWRRDLARTSFKLAEVDPDAAVQHLRAAIAGFPTLEGEGALNGAELDYLDEARQCLEALTRVAQ